MYLRQPLLIIGHLFLALAFLFTPIIDNMHAIKMLATKPSDMQNTSASIQVATSKASLPPCHEAAITPTETVLHETASAPDADNSQTCCPYDECSPDNCLMHMAIANICAFEMLSHSTLNQRSFLLIEIYPVPLPTSERLRPPIA